jgi:hypothetical protein
MKYVAQGDGADLDVNEGMLFICSLVLTVTQVELTLARQRRKMQPKDQQKIELREVNSMLRLT